MPFSFRIVLNSHCFVTNFNKKQCLSALIAFHLYSRETTVNSFFNKTPLNYIAVHIICAIIKWIVVQLKASNVTLFQWYTCHSVLKSWF